MRRTIWNKRPISVLFRTRTYIVSNRYSRCAQLFTTQSETNAFSLLLCYPGSDSDFAPRTTLEMDAWLTPRPKNGVPVVASERLQRFC